MANIKSAIKRARQNTKRRAHNASQRSNLRTHIKNVLKAVDSGDAAKAQDSMKAAQKVIDKAVTKGIIHKNKAARAKQRLVAKVKALAA